MSVLVILRREEGAEIHAAIFRGYRSAVAAAQDRFQVPKHLSQVEITHDEDRWLSGKLDNGVGTIIAWNDMVSAIHIDHEHILIRFSAWLSGEFRHLQSGHFFMFEADVRLSNMDSATAVLTIRET